MKAKLLVSVSGCVLAVILFSTTVHASTSLPVMTGSPAAAPWMSSDAHGPKVPTPDPTIAAPEPSATTLASVALLLIPILDVLANASGLTLKKQKVPTKLVRR